MWSFSSRTLSVSHSPHSWGFTHPSFISQSVSGVLGNLVSSGSVALCCRKSLGDTASRCLGPPFAEGDVHIGVEKCVNSLRAELTGEVFHSSPSPLAGVSCNDCTQMMRQCVRINVLSLNRANTSSMSSERAIKKCVPASMSATTRSPCSCVHREYVQRCGDGFRDLRARVRARCLSTKRLRRQRKMHRNARPPTPQAREALCSIGAHCGHQDGHRNATISK